MGCKRILATGGGVLACSLVAAAAASGAVGDLASIRADYRLDSSITRCRFTLGELESARVQVAGNPDEAYSNFAGVLDGEIARLRAKFCRGAVAESQRKKSSLKVNVTSVVARGGTKAERVRMRNKSSKEVSFGKATLRNRSGGRVALKGIKIPGKSSVTVYISCRPKSQATTPEGRAYACSKSALLADKGDVLRLVDAKGVVVHQRGFERYDRVYAF